MQLPGGTLIENGVRLDGVIAAGLGRRVLLFSNTIPVQETVTLSAPPIKRICGYTGTAVRISPDGTGEDN